MQSDHYNNHNQQQQHQPLNTHETSTSSNSNITNEQEKLEKEIKHLLHRINHVQESIQLSSQSSALFNPQTWQENCLFAVRNCVFEWRQILKYHGLNENSMCKTAATDTTIATNTDSFIHDDNPTNANNVDNDDRILTCGKETEETKNNNEKIIIDTALKIFGLIQMAVQVGPLKGSNPGYFKRCGSDVSKMALDFLRQCVFGPSYDSTEGNEKEEKEEDDDSNERPNDYDEKNHIKNHIFVMTSQQLQFTERQCSILFKWITNAEKAVCANNPPSKSALKLQASSKSKKSQRRKKYIHNGKKKK